MKKYLTLGVAILLVVSVFGTVTGIGVGVEEEDVGDNSLSGGSVAEDSIEIANWTDLNDVRDNLTGNYVLMNNLDENTDGYEKYVNITNGWGPIGNNSNPFMGYFDGNGSKIGDLYINRTDELRVGLFGATDDGAEITELGVVDAEVSGRSRVGGLVGVNDGTVSDSYATGNVSGDSNVGGVVGSNSGTVSDSYATGNVSGDGDWYVGGLVGENSGTVENSHYNIDEVLINGGHHVTLGGLYDAQYQDWIDDKNLQIEDYSDSLDPVGEYYEISDVQGIKDLLGFAGDEKYKFRLADDIDLSGEQGLYIPYLGADFDGNGYTISNLEIDLPFVNKIGMFGFNNGGTVSDIGLVNTNVSGDWFVGGLIGENSGTVSDSYATGKLSGDWFVGGLVGGNSGTVSDSYATGNLSGDWFVGGVVGRTDEGTVNNSYATGNVNGSYEVGGLVGYNGGTVSDSYATGNVSGDSNVGGLVGSNSGTVSDSYATGDVSGECCVGGLVGYNDEGTVENSYATGNVSGNENVGELIGKDKEENIIDRIRDIPGFTSLLLLLASILTVAIYRKKSKKR